MDRFQELQTLLAVAEVGGFSAAARKLGLSPPAVTRIIAGLEARLGTTMFTRTTRQVRLTEAGARLVEDARRILGDLQEAEESATGLHAAPRGRLTITAPVLFGQRYVAPIIAEFLDQYPEVEARLLFLDRVVNIMEEGIDIAIRIADLPDSGLLARKVGAVRVQVAAAPAYLARHGVPVRPEDLSAHRIIHTATGIDPMPWAFQHGEKPIALRLPARLNVNSNQSALDLVERGWGIGRLLSYQLAPSIHAGRAIALLEEFALPARPVHVVHTGGHGATAKLRSAVDFLTDRLTAEPALSAA